LTVLRQHWATHRDPVWLFPARNLPHGGSAGKGPMQAVSVQKAMARVVEQLNFKKTVTTHTLRHSYATHLLEAGVNLRLIQHYLGHRSLRTTMVYLHVTSQGQKRALTLIEGVMAE
jgi:site-specific recombinase XerD